MLATFGAFTFDDTTRELRRGDRVVHLSPKAFDLLTLLLERSPKALSKADLHRELWPETFVSDGSLAVLIAEIRRAIGDTACETGFVRTVNRFGYRFVGADADIAPKEAPADGRTATCSLTWGAEHARLKRGQNVIGRDPDADIWIDAVGVSRRHAIVVVDEEAVSLQDLASKNGTFLNGVRVTTSISLPDCAEIRLGAVPIQFRRSSTVGPTQTVSGSGGRRGSS